ncbi:MAG: OpgC domain-containing protein, partial [Candidatus Acidiferrum sp.]
NEMGSFDLWAWQFLWIAGIWLGVRWGQGDLPIEKWARRAAIPALLIACPLFALRRALEHGVELGPYEFLFDKWHLGPLRLLNFVAVGALLIVLQSFLNKPLAIRPLVLMGQSSLQVFCVHLLFCFAGLTLLGNAAMLSGARQVELLAVTFTAMLVTAKLFSKSEAKQERQPKTDAPLGLRTGAPLLAPAQPAPEPVRPTTGPMPAAVATPGD